MPRLSTRAVHGAAALLLSATVATAQAAPIDTADVLADWTAGASPITGGIAGDWGLTFGGDIDGTGNHVGSLVSDFTAANDYDFSVDVRHADNDTFGILWGFQDLANHYRISWTRDFGETGVGVNPSTGFGGIFDGFRVIKEEGGVSSVLSFSATEYQRNRTYRLGVSGTATGFDILVTDLVSGAAVFDLSFDDDTFSSGKVGIHDFFQSSTGLWSNFDFTPGTPVPAPGPLVLLAGLLLAVGARRTR